MFVARARSNARAWSIIRQGPVLLGNQQQKRCKSGSPKDNRKPKESKESEESRDSKGDMYSRLLKVKGPVAAELMKTGTWKLSQRGRLVKSRKHDQSRVNIVSEELCDDILTSIKPTLQRHTGCDLIDINPGAGLWSRKLHEALQPRSHIMLEPDADLYRPFLEPILEKPGAELLTKLGILWSDLEDVLKTKLPHQKEYMNWEQAPPPRNDTLVITANVSWWPKKRFGKFDSLAQLLLYQFLSWVRAGSLVNRYGLVRMLVWCGDEDKRAILPRVLQRRRRSAVLAEMSTDWIVEVAGDDVEPGKETISRFQRDHAIDIESCRNALKRMEEQGIKIPPGRETRLVREVREMDDDVEVVAGSAAVSATRAWEAELEALEESYANKEFAWKSEQYVHLRRLRARKQWTKTRGTQLHELLQQRDELYELRKSKTVSPEELAQREAEWNKEVAQLNKDLRKEFTLNRDNLHVFRQDPPVLNWDRRYMDPLTVRSNEFFPNAPCSLLDIQPKAPHPLLHDKNPGLDPVMRERLNAKGGQGIIQFLNQNLLSGLNSNVRATLNSVAPGLASMILPHCESYHDVEKGGSPIGGWGEIGARSLNETQFIEILEQYLKSPHTPTFHELLHGDPLVSDDEHEEEMSTPGFETETLGASDADV